MLSSIEREISQRQELLEEIHDTMQSYIYTAKIIFDETLDKGGSVFMFGNGKSVLNIGHVVRGFGRKNKNQVLSLCEDIVDISAIANSLGADRIFDRQIELVAKEGDLLVGFSASGNSKNVLRALSLGRNLGCKTIGFSGLDGGFMDEFCDLNITIPSDDTAKIYEMHLMLANIVFHT